MTASPRDGLVAEYLLSGNAQDTSGRGHHGVEHGVTPCPDRFGKAGNACYFDGVDDFIEVTPPPSLNDRALTVSVWVRYDRRTLRGWTNCIVAQDNGNDTDQSARVFQLSTDHQRIVWHRMIGARDPMCKPRVRFGVWYHLVAVVDDGEHRLYLDGVLQDAERHRFWTHATQPLHIGRKGSDEAYFFFKGAIDDLRIYDRALTSTEITALFHEGGFEKPASPPAEDEARARPRVWRDSRLRDVLMRARIRLQRLVWGRKRQSKAENARLLQSRGETIASFVIRDATLTDIPALARLHVTAWNAAYAVTSGPTVELRERQWRETFSKPSDKWFVLLVVDPKGELVGFARGIRRGDGTGDFNKLYLLPTYQRCGLGTRLVGHLVRRFLAMGVRSMSGYVEPGNPSGGFFERIGGRWGRDPNGGVNYSWYVWDDLEQVARRWPID